MSLPKIILWLLFSALVIFAICEGIYQLMGNGVLARTVCTICLIAAAPFLLKPFIHKNLAGDDNDGDGDTEKKNHPDND